ncbi:hypothetical protein Tco_1028437 [Tanacetum coccineum]|uniref:Reverse transcriptase domain-containing protein n=1 Tax=Tanacetum coccineum TaxID=301880 RepID=A0ABQ5G0J6_9ASTR
MHLTGLPICNLELQGHEELFDLPDGLKKMESVVSISNCSIGLSMSNLRLALCMTILFMVDMQCVRPLILRQLCHDMGKLKKKDDRKYCPRARSRKSEAEMWNLKVKAPDVVAYNRRFQTSSLMCAECFRRVRQMKISLGNIKRDGTKLKNKHTTRGNRDGYAKARQRTAFKLLKQQAVQCTILALPEGKRDFIAYCDGFKDGCGRCVDAKRKDRSKKTGEQSRRRMLGGMLVENSKRSRRNSEQKVGTLVPLGGLQVDENLHFVEEPVEIMDREVKQLRRSRVPIVKVRWNSRRGPEFTWEREDQFRKKYPHLFSKTAPSTSAMVIACGTKAFI